VLMRILFWSLLLTAIDSGVLFCLAGISWAITIIILKLLAFIFLLLTKGRIFLHFNKAMPLRIPQLKESYSKYIGDLIGSKKIFFYRSHLFSGNIAVYGFEKTFFILVSKDFEEILHTNNRDIFFSIIVQEIENSRFIPNTIMLVALSSVILLNYILKSLRLAKVTFFAVIIKLLDILITTVFRRSVPHTRVVLDTLARDRVRMEQKGFLKAWRMVVNLSEQGSAPLILEQYAIRECAQKDLIDHFLQLHFPEERKI